MIENCLFWARMFGLPSGLYCPKCKQSVHRALVWPNRYQCLECKTNLIFHVPEVKIDVPNPNIIVPSELEQDKRHGNKMDRNIDFIRTNTGIMSDEKIATELGLKVSTVRTYRHLGGIRK